MTDEDENEAVAPSDAEIPESATGQSATSTSALNDAFYEYFERERKEEEEKYSNYAGKPEYTDALKSAFDKYVSIETFAPGDLVQWKPLMKSRPYPRYSAPAVFVSYIAEPQLRDRDGDLMSEPLDAVLGFLNGDGDFLVFSYSSRRFTRWIESA